MACGMSVCPILTITFSATDTDWGTMNYLTAKENGELQGTAMETD